MPLAASEGRERINEIHLGTPHFIEIANLGNADSALAGGSLAVESAGVVLATVTFPEGTLLAPHETLVVTDSAAFGPSPAGEVFVVASLQDIAIAGSVVVLRNAGGQILDVVAPAGAGIGLPATVLPGVPGLPSLQRVVLEDSDVPEEWLALPGPTPLAMNFGQIVPSLATSWIDRIGPIATLAGGPAGAPFVLLADTDTVWRQNESTYPFILAFSSRLVVVVDGLDRDAVDPGAFLSPQGAAAVPLPPVMALEPCRFTLQWVAVNATSLYPFEIIVSNPAEIATSSDLPGSK